jgi:hypothetical protein
MTRTTLSDMLSRIYYIVIYTTPSTSTHAYRYQMSCHNTTIHKLIVIFAKHIYFVE